MSAVAIPWSVSLATASERLTALMAPPVSKAATRSAPGSFCSKASTAEASSTTGPSLKASRLVPLGDQFVGQTGAIGNVSANKFSGPFDGLLDGMDPQFTFRYGQHNLGPGLEAELTANFGGDDDPAAFGHFGSECWHVRPHMSQIIDFVQFST